MKHSFKKIMASLLVAVMILSVSPVDAISEIDFSSLFSVKATALTSGKFTYELSGTNATITGYSGTDTNLTIPSKLDGNTVVAIKQGAFANNKNIKQVTIPGTVVKIGQSYWDDGAFAGCSKLSTVTILDGQSDAFIGTRTFKDCSSLKSVTIPGNYTTVCSEAFMNCISLQSMIYKKSGYDHANQAIGSDAFKNCTSLESITLPTTLNKIDSNAFASCSLLSLVIPEGVTHIANSAFEGNKYLTTLSLPSTLTQIGNSYWDGGAFAGCSRLETVSIEKGKNDAFIGTRTFKDCSALKSVTIPGNYTTVCGEAFMNCTSLGTMTYEESGYDHANQTISSDAFKNCTSLKSISLPSTLNKIDSSAFLNCALTSLVIPEGVTHIANSAFENNKSLVTLSLPGTLTQIGNSYWDGGAFAGCSKLTTVTFAAGENDAFIGTRTFKGCSALKSITVPGNYTTICSEAFMDCVSLQSMTYEKSDYGYSNQTICSDAFKNCSSLSSISLPSTLNKIDSSAFMNCALTLLVIPEGVTHIANSAFENNKSLLSLSLPSTLTQIGNTYWDGGAFAGCSKLTTVIFAEGKKDLVIGTRTFKGCSSLTTVHLPLNLTNICEEAFANTNANLTICSKSNSSYGKTYADSNSIKFKRCDGTHNAIGDVNGDGQINSSDALLVLQHAVKKITLTGNAFTAADTNKDKQLNSSDALKILQFSVGKIKEF